jgi:uncharacterized protein (DUF1697 family)
MVSYVAFLRGINVGGHHKLPMKDLVRVLADRLGIAGARTVLNSGNALFEWEDAPAHELEAKLEACLEAAFEFPVPCVLRTAGQVKALLLRQPFGQVEMNEHLRCYLAFLKDPALAEQALPWASPDGSFRLIDAAEGTLCGVLDLQACPTPKGMEALEKHFGKGMTTRNWNTLERIGKLLQ